MAEGLRVRAAEVSGRSLTSATGCHPLAFLRAVRRFTCELDEVCLTENRLRLDRLAQRQAPDFLPRPAVPSSSPPNKFADCRPPLHFGPMNHPIAMGPRGCG
jgi:hypothetical protein